MSNNSNGRVRIFNFDPVEQAKLWVSLGPEEAVKTLNGYLRTAVLIGEQVVLDRNDLLDGIYFLSLGPEGIAEVLGVPNYEKLPLLIMGYPIKAESWVKYAKDTQRVLPKQDLLPKAFDSNISLQLRPISINQQLDETDSDGYWESSSALYASLGPLNISKNSNSWMIGEDFTKVFPGSGFTHKNLTVSNASIIKNLIRDSREKWATAIYKGKIDAQAFRSWGEISTAPENNNQNNEARAIKQALENVALQSNNDLLVNELNSLPATTVRKTITGHITKHKFISCPHCKYHIQTLWSKAYAQALAWKDQAVLLTFPSPTEPKFNRNSSSNDQNCLLFNQQQYNSAQKSPASKNEDYSRSGNNIIEIPGGLIDQLRNIGPDSYRFLYNSDTPRPISDQPIKFEPEQDRNLEDIKKNQDLRFKIISKRIRNLKYNTNKLYPNFSSASKDMRGLLLASIQKTFFATLLFFIALFSDDILIDSESIVNKEVKVLILFIGAFISFLLSLPFNEWNTIRFTHKDLNSGSISIELFEGL
ncbi:hypothetical protein [Rothia nasimurium]|uniref:hypothetical protein n=1 Tax=Rothia nasimurium TaxID=85336 RepID=UPI001F324FBD|nr:hypothetical protein [Rothia nasimurium]